jgi:hypothetical protein
MQEDQALCFRENLLHPPHTTEPIEAKTLFAGKAEEREITVVTMSVVGGGGESGAISNDSKKSGLLYITYVIA